MKKIAALLQFLAFGPFDHLISRCPPQVGGTPKAQAKNYFSRRFVKYSSISSATCLEYLTASTTVRAPSTTSPLAKIPSRVVWPCSSVASRPWLLISKPVVVLTMRFCAPWLMAMMTLEQGKNCSSLVEVMLPSSSISTFL